MTYSLDGLETAQQQTAAGGRLCECILQCAATGVPSTSAAEQLEALLVHNDPNSESERSRQRHRGTPLHVVAQVAGAPSCSALLRAKAQVDALDAHGRTPLHLGAMRGTSDVVDLLIQAVSCAGTSSFAATVPP